MRMFKFSGAVSMFSRVCLCGDFHSMLNQKVGRPAEEGDNAFGKHRTDGVGVLKSRFWLDTL